MGIGENEVDICYDNRYIKVQLEHIERFSPVLNKDKWNIEVLLKQGDYGLYCELYENSILIFRNKSLCQEYCDDMNILLKIMIYHKKERVLQELRQSKLARRNII